MVRVKETQFSFPYFSCQGTSLGTSQEDAWVWNLRFCLKIEFLLLKAGRLDTMTKVMYGDISIISQHFSTPLHRVMKGYKNYGGLSKRFEKSINQVYE